jgi:hypothetical protein
MSDYDPFKGINKTTRLLVTEGIGYGIAGNIANTVDTAVGNHIATDVFSTGASMAGIPSLLSGTENVMDSVNNLFKKKKD